MLGCGAHVRIIVLPHVRCACESVCGKVFASSKLELCFRCACVPLVLGVRYATRFPVSKRSFTNLEHPFLFSNVLFLFLNILSCFRTAYSDSKHPKICWKKYWLTKGTRKSTNFFLKDIWKKCGCECDHQKMRCGAKVLADQLLKCGCACATQQNVSQPNPNYTV